MHRLVLPGIVDPFVLRGLLSTVSMPVCSSIGVAGVVPGSHVQRRAGGIPRLSDTLRKRRLIFVRRTLCPFRLASRALHLLFKTGLPARRGRPGMTYQAQLCPLN